jgi:hypothetical protein
MKPYYRTSISVDGAIRSDFDQETFIRDSDKPHDPVSIWAFRGSDVFKVFNEEWISYIESTVGMEVSFALLFYRDPFIEFEEVHIDIDPDRNMRSVYSLNFVNDELDDSSMIWYDVSIESVQFTYTQSMKPYLYLPK